MRSEVKAKRAGRTVAKAFRRLPFREQQELLRQSQAYTFDDLAEAFSLRFGRRVYPKSLRGFCLGLRNDLLELSQILMVKAASSFDARN